jgi:endoribonuclease Dicer
VQAALNPLVYFTLLTYIEANYDRQTLLKRLSCTLGILPRVLTWIEYSANAAEFSRKVAPKLDCGDMLEALAAFSASLHTNYERLEILGDAFLNCMSATYLYVKHMHTYIGNIEKAYRRIISNKYLSELGKKCGLPKYIITKPLGAEPWGALITAIPSSTTEVQKLKFKKVADVFESVIGASLLHLGEHEALKTALSLGLEFKNIHSWEDFSSLTTPKKGIMNGVEIEIMEKFTALVKKQFGYCFKTPELLVDVLLSSKFLTINESNKQPLYFLGHSVYAYLTLEHLFHHHPTERPFGLTTMRAFCMSDAVLGFLSVEHGIHKLAIQYSNSSSSIKKYQNTLKSADCFKDYAWVEIMPPKILVIVLTSLLGAIYVDSGFDFVALKAIFNTAFRDFLKPKMNLKLLDIEEFLQKLKDCKAIDIRYVFNVNGLQCHGARQQTF